MKKTMLLCVDLALVFAMLASCTKSSEVKFEPETGIVQEITATSELDAAGGKYAAQNASNGHWTSWVEGNSGDGIGEQITLTLKEPVSLKFICIKSGFGNLAYYWANNRPKDITLILDGEKSKAIKWQLADTPVAQYITINEYSKRYSQIALRIESVYKGTDPADDCAIDEIAVNAGISRHVEYGAYYDDEDHAYVYDPETQRMLKGLYTLDVGSDRVRVTEQG
ncbi:MAG: hypothetical protein K6G80_00450, partial [Treponema sp.]|nr:hypothetical protein [Treponema sp.]